jgi:hypothetical protein
VKVAEVKNCERVLISNYNCLCSDYGKLESIFTMVQKEKADFEKAGHDKVQRFRQQLCTKLHGLRQELEKSIGELGGRCLDFPNTGGTIRRILDWFKGEVQALPDTFAEANQNITCFTVAGVLKRLVEIGCKHMPELWKLAGSSNASLLHEIPADIRKIARKVVRRWWTHHWLPYYKQRLKEDNQVSFIPVPLF